MSFPRVADELRIRIHWGCRVAAVMAGFVASGIAGGAEAFPGTGYPTSAAIGERMADLGRAYPETIRSERLGTNLAVLVVSRIPEAKRADFPALLVVGGIEANDLTGPVSALAAAEALVIDARTNEISRRVLEGVSLFIVPRLSTAESPWHVRPREERTVESGPPVDADHDGLLDEDGAEDLDGDGVIASLRVQDPAGEFILDPADPRLLIRADRARGEVGAWRWLAEGRDNDGDEAWNEDGRGGVNFNRNFPAGFRYFDPSSGLNPVSEPATRALADFVVAHPNIAVTFTFGSADNLTEPTKGEPGGKRPATAMHETDVPWLKELGSAWRKALKLEKELPGVPGPGTFSDWMYFHRGRLALAARPWFPGLALEFIKPTVGTNVSVAGTGTNAPAPAAKKPDARPESEKRNEEERAYLRWLDTNAPSGFVAWKKFEHPDFPGKTAEIGGFAPWAKSNPPESLLPELARRQAGFLVELAARLPRIGIRRTEVKARGNGIFDLRVEVENTGYLPTVLAHGEVTRSVIPTRVALGIDDAAVLSGNRIQRLGPIPGSGGMAEVRWVVLAPGRANLEVEVISALAGRATASFGLTEERR